MSSLPATTDVSLTTFELAPGETFHFDWRRHLDQEEVFHVSAGTTLFRTETGDVEISPAGVLRFAPGEFRLGRDDGPERMGTLALGALRGSTALAYLRPCSMCGKETIQTVEVDEESGAIRIQCETGETVVDEVELGTA